MNNLEKLTTNIKTKIAEKKQKKLDLLNNIRYIEEIKQQLSAGEIQNIDIKALETIIKEIGIEEDEIFQQLQHVLEEFSMDTDEFTTNISKEKEIELLLTTFKQLQEYAVYQEDLEEKIVESYISILMKIIESLYDKEVQNIRNSTEYKKIDNEIKELEELLETLNKQEQLTQEEKDNIYNYIVNSDLEDKIGIYTELTSMWIEQARKSLKEKTVASLPEDEVTEIAKVQEQQRKELSKLTGEMTKEEWKERITQTIELIKENANLTPEQKSILEKILLASLNEELEDLNMAKALLDEYPEINIDTRNQEYLTSTNFETNLVGVDLVMHLIPNIANEEFSEISTIINQIIEKFKNIFLSKEELDEIKEQIQTFKENYDTMTYIDYSDEKIRDLESMFIEFKGEKEKILDFDRYAAHLLENEEVDYDDFAQNTFKKIIKTKLDKLYKLLENGLVKRNEKEKIDELRDFSKINLTIFN